MIRADKEYIIEARRHIHRRPELGFDLDETVAFVKEELTKMGIPFTEKPSPTGIIQLLAHYFLAQPESFWAVTPTGQLSLWQEIMPEFT